MDEWIRSLLDILLILMVGVGIYQAARLINHLTGLRQSRGEMERFVHEFNATVIRAEAGIKGLKHAARESGDDLERLVEKAMLLRDELSFIVESADQVAERLTQSASKAVRPEAPPRTEKKAEPAKPAAEAKAPPAAAQPPRAPEVKDGAQPSSRAEKELLQALQKLS